MDTKQFLQHVLPAEGPYCICHPNANRGYTQLPAEDLDAAVAISRQFDREGHHTYFAVGALRKAQTFDPKLNNGAGAFRTMRVGENIRGLRSYIIDIDAGEGRQYSTVNEALAALKSFCKKATLPQPTIINSGNGLHVYWTLTEEVPQATWETQGAKLKELASGSGLRFDPGRTADSSSVLRIVGTHNWKYDPAPVVEALWVGQDSTPTQFHSLLGTSPAVAILGLPAGGTNLEGVTSNVDVDKQYPATELDFKLLLDNCAQFHHIAIENQMTATNPQWMHAVQLCVHMHNGRKAAHLISKTYPGYTPGETDRLFDRLTADGIGPTRCDTFQKDDRALGRPDGCAGCPSRDKITSPAQVARYVKVLPTPVAIEALPAHEFIPPPFPYFRTTNGIAMHVKKDGVESTKTICPYDMYPTKLRYNEQTKLEDDVQWCIDLPKRGWTIVDLPQGIPQMQLHSTLAKRGIYFNALNAPLLGQFMTAYMRELQHKIKTERAFAKFGWREEGFALGDRLFKTDGTIEEHSTSSELMAATRNGVYENGELDLWLKAIQFYNRPGMEAYRAYLYSSFASPLYHMSNHPATFVSATGLPGIGKSTLLDGCASIWGNPARLVVRGGKHGTTRTALEVITDGLHNLPLLMDEISDRDPKEMAEFIFSYSAGCGKARGRATGGLRTDTATWANIALVNTNADEHDRMMAVNRDNSAHMLRLVQLQFVRVPFITKESADEVSRSFFTNFGLAGNIFIAAIAPHYDKLRARLELYDREVSTATNATSDERFWLAWAASARLAAEIASALGLLPGFPVAKDVQWMSDQIRSLRGQVARKIPTAIDFISEFLDASIDHTLRLSTKASNIGNILLEPRGELGIRHDVDTGEIAIANTAFHTYCNKQVVNYTRVIEELLKAGIVSHASTPRTLGAGTKWSAGRVRCIVLDINKISTQPKLVVSNPAPAIVLPVKVTK